MRYESFRIEDGWMYLYVMDMNNGIYYICAPVPDWIISELDMKPVRVPRIIAPRYYTTFHALCVKGWELWGYERPYYEEIFRKRCPEAE